mgnify:CR=1 FL=1|jgi:hypothetical protein|tara:strand:- start:1259 stop:1465 length:207 start_codon:yes stop_codon:yes gene_type:complete
MNIEIMSVIRKMLEDQHKKYENARDGSLKQWDSNYKTNEYKRRAIQEFIIEFDEQLYNPLIEKIMKGI